MQDWEAPLCQALVDGDEHSTTLIMRSMKNTERVYNNKTAKQVLAIEQVRVILDWKNRHWKNIM